MLRRFLDPSHPDAVRRHITRLTAARTVANTAYRVTAPFARVIGRGLGVSLDTMGLAMSAGDLSGISAPVIGRAVDRRSRRGAMSLGLALVCTSCVVLATSPAIVAFAVGLVGVAMSKVVFDSSLAAWIAEHTDYDLRGQVTGLTEISWSLSLLVGVPLCGVIMTVTNWRVAFAVLALANMAASANVWRKLDHGTARPAPHADAHKGLVRASLPAYLGFGGLMTGATCLFVTYGAWFEDAFGMSTATIGVVTVLLGLGELLASSSTVRFTDRLGKRVAVMCGASLMAPMGLLLATVGGHEAIGIVTLALFFVGFEFAIVSAFPLIGELHPAARASSVGVAVGFGTVGRGIAAVASTRLYTAHGIGGSAILATGCAVLVLVCFGFGVTEP